MRWWTICRDYQNYYLAMCGSFVPNPHRHLARHTIMIQYDLACKLTQHKNLTAKGQLIRTIVPKRVYSWASLCFVMYLIATTIQHGKSLACIAFCTNCLARVIGTSPCSGSQLQFATGLCLQQGVCQILCTPIRACQPKGWWLGVIQTCSEGIATMVISGATLKVVRQDCRANVSHQNLHRVPYRQN